MNEHEAEKRIRQAVTEKTAFLDGLPSQEKEILDRIPMEDEKMTIAYGRTRVFPQEDGRPDGRDGSGRWRRHARW